jgi:hypothetical protein
VIPRACEVTGAGRSRGGVRAGPCAAAAPAEVRNPEILGLSGISMKARTAMITKTFFLTKEIRAIRTKRLRQKKSLRDHGYAPACQM